MAAPGDTQGDDAAATSQVPTVQGPRAEYVAATDPDGASETAASMATETAASVESGEVRHDAVPAALSQATPDTIAARSTSRTVRVSFVGLMRDAGAIARERYRR